MPPTVNLSRFIVEINGQKMTDTFMRDVEEIVVDTSLYVPDMVAIRLQDDDMEWMDSADFELGKTVKITAESAESIGGGTGVLIEAEITGLEPEFDATGTHVLVIRGYDKSHRLHLGHHTRTFTNQTDSDIAKTFATEAGLTPEVDTTTIQYEYLIQNNQTNMEFLAERARQIGYRVFTSAGKLYFKKPDFVLTSDTKLTLGESLRSFRPRMSSVHQADKVRVVSWDIKAKAQIKDEQTQPATTKQGGMKKTGGALADSAFSMQAVYSVTNQPLNSVSEATALASGQAVRLGENFLEAEGSCYGNPAVLAGVRLAVEGMGTRFSGSYFITSATHHYTKEGYETHFSVSGDQPNTINHLLERANGRRSRTGRCEGVVVGVVTNLKDPDELGRVLVKYPWLVGDGNAEVGSTWARMAAPMAGQDTKGFYFLPEVNDEVLMAFEHGDMSRPYVVGTLWNGKDKPPKTNTAVEKGGKINQRIIRSRLGHMITLDDSDDKPSIEIIDKTGKNRVHIDSKSNAMTIEIQGDLNITAGSNITIEAKQAINLKAGTNVQVNATKDLTTDSMNATVKAKGTAALQGTRTSIKANVDADMEGKFVNVKSDGPAIVKGNPIMLN